MEPGTRLGPYEIIEQLGAGGMGEVYRARDTRLDRDVAIKVLPEHFATDVEHLARFEREAKLLAQLNHPNVATIHGFEQSGAVSFIAMELVDGESLAQRVADTGPIELDEALGIARQVALGLEAAHGAGLIHRDLKPANVVVAPDGTAKILDFGLAKASSGAATSVSPDLTQSPTVMAATGAGVIMGTAGYMSPEQAKGKPLDKRTDIWSFGVLLYEMLTGTSPFRGEDVSEVLAGILKDEPDWGVLPAGAPAALRSLLRRCMTKNPEGRLHDVADGRIEIDEMLDPSAGGPMDAVPTARVAPLGPWAFPLAGAALAVGLVGGIFGPSLPAAPGSSVHLSVPLPPGLRLGVPNNTLQRPSRASFALAPDGASIVYVSTDGEGSRLYLRALDQAGAAPIPGTEGSDHPFFSPDGESVGFFVGGALKSVPLGGGTPRTIVTDLPIPFGASWGSAGTIAIGLHGGGLLVVPEAGGDPEALTSLDTGTRELSHRLPHFLPNGQDVLFTRVTSVTDWSTAEIVLFSADTGEQTVLEQGADPHYAATGHLIFARDGTMLAAPLDLQSRQIGPAVRVLEEVMQAANAPNTGEDSGAAQFDISDSGLMAYVPGGIFPSYNLPMQWVDRDGRVVEPVSGVMGRLFPRVSPDQRYLAYERDVGYAMDLWVHDLQRGTARPLTDGGVNIYPEWSPDGSRIAFSSDRHGGLDSIYVVAADGRGEPERVTRSEYSQLVGSWSSRGDLVFLQGTDSSRLDIWVLPAEAEGWGEPRPFLESPDDEAAPAFSPDGDWLAYSSDEGQRRQVWMRPYPAAEPAELVSVGRGQNPVWSSTGGELFYRAGQRWMVVDMTPDGPGEPRLLFEDGGAFAMSNPVRSYDLARDGRFVTTDARSGPEPQPVGRINVVLNWFEELKERAQVPN